MESLRLTAPAKINWRLAVTGRRADGYHLLTGLMQSISLSDSLCLQVAERDSCLTKPPLAGAPEHNLALQAWLLLKRELGLRQGLAIEITKNIPVGGGLAGGSADAAAVLLGANQLFDLQLSMETLSAMGLKLGADVPFCLLGGLAKAEGVGERLTSLPSPPPLPLLLVNPGISVPTAQVFKQYRESGCPFADTVREEDACAELASALAAGDRAAIKGLLKNDLAAPAQQLYPQIGHLAQRLRDIGLQPLLSGSGATLFALLEDGQDLPWARQKLGEVAWLTAAHTV